MVEGLLEVTELPAELHTLMQAKAEGNPFFLEEIIRSLIDQGHIARNEIQERWQITSGINEIAIPETMQALLASRIDGLSPGARNALQLASVIGRTFHRHVLDRVLENGKPIDQDLNHLQRAELIYEASRDSGVVYSFRSELLREAANGNAARRQHDKPGPHDRPPCPHRGGC